MLARRLPIDPAQSALLGSLIKAHRPRLVALAEAAGQNADDIVQNVCLAVLEGRLALSESPRRALRILERAVARRATRVR